MISSRRSIAAILIAAAALAGCSSAPEAARPLAAAVTAPEPSPAPSPAPSPTPSPTPTALTKAQAAKIYLDAVTPLNKAFGELNAALKAGDLERIRSAAKVCTKANRVFLVALTDTPWPRGVQKHADKVAEVTAGYQSAFTALANAKTLEEVDAATATLSLDNSQAQLMRVKLGLGAVPPT